ncbi:hypothetical protein P775_08255 [Puniceibacterium antarcticum]|uniref:Uncharacterized protein n=1 Tax=Puniceibacterium antarcticum TaxID=1206336 RepID=A0A2G8RGI3_9RHOB|nr:hypothetical protein [Puniceibacterium antarcticum]PIL20511.1 hypothetical protein P775_08255 [Puniceibacterium antarcticum]
MTDQMKYPDKIDVVGRMAKTGRSPLDREFRGEARVYHPGRLAGEIYVNGAQAKEIYDRDQAKIASLRAKLNRLQRLYDDTASHMLSGIKVPELDQVEPEISKGDSDAG